MISGYPEGSDLTIMNAVYHYAKRGEDGKYGDDIMTVVFKDNVTGLKDHRQIHKPEIAFNVVKEEFATPYPLFFIEKEKTDVVTTPFKDLDKAAAEATGQLDLFYENIKCGNRRANKMIHMHPRLMGSDININNYYRLLFDRTYKNDITPIDKAYLDIEADIINLKGDFPEPGECPVNATSIFMEKTNTMYTLLLRNHNNPLIQEFEDELAGKGFDTEFNSFLEKQVGGWKNIHRMHLKNIKVEIIFFDDELTLLENIFRIINIIQPDFVLAWNMGFDVPYLIQRIINLGGNPTEIICHPDFREKYCEYFVDEQHRSVPEQRGDYADIASYSVWLDQLIQFASRRKGQSAAASFKLDDIGEAIAKVRKYDYKDITPDLAHLPYLNYKVFVLYNMMDVMVQKCIEEKTGDTNYVFSKAMANCTQYAKVHRQTVYLVNRARMLFDKNNGCVLGNNANKMNEKPEEKFGGAFVADPNLVSDMPKLNNGGQKINVFRNANDFDYKRLYPSLAQESNTAPNTQIGMIEIPTQVYDNENRRNDPKYSRACEFIENLASKNYISFAHRWLHLANFRELYEDVVEYWTTKKTPFNGCLDLKLSQGIKDIAYRVYPDQLTTIAKRIDVTKPLQIVDRYVRMPESIKNQYEKIVKEIKL